MGYTLPLDEMASDRLMWELSDRRARHAVGQCDYCEQTSDTKPCKFPGRHTGDVNAGPEIVVLCGSTRFINEFDKANLRLTLKGLIVLSIGCVTSTDVGPGIDEDTKSRLDELHKRKIDMADWVYVLNVDGYIGESTRSEIDYANKHGKRVEYLVNVAGAGEGADHD